jgi:hypothetical protein
MAGLKTKPTGRSVTQFIRSIPDEPRRRDCEALVRMMKAATGAPPRMWGPSIVGFGSYHYVYGSGREGDWFLAGFSPRRQSLTLYLMGGLDDGLLERLGPHTTGVACLYIKRLDQIDQAALRALIKSSVARAKKMRRSRG